MSRAFDALSYYEAKAQQMQRASLRGDTKSMLALMQELALDGGAIARRAIDLQAAPEPATVAVDAGALAELREALRDLDDYWRHTPLMERHAVQEMASAARRLLDGGE